MEIIMSEKADYSEKIQNLLLRATGLYLSDPTLDGKGNLLFNDIFTDNVGANQFLERLNSILPKDESKLYKNETSVDYRNVSSRGNVFGNLNVKLTIQNSADAVQHIQDNLEKYIATDFVKNINSVKSGLDPEQAKKIISRILKQATSELGITQEQPAIDDNSAVARLRRSDFKVPNR